MRKFYTEPSMSISMFENENLLTAVSAITGTKSDVTDVEALKESHAVKVIDVSNLKFTF